MKSGRKLDSLIVKLFNTNIIKFGAFRLKSGIISPFYFDLRPIISFPGLLVELADTYIEKMKDLKFDRIAGIPFTGLPISTAISIRGNFPMVYCREKPKEYGTHHLVEGIYKKCDKLLVIDDTITDGNSKLSIVVSFMKNEFRINDILVFLDREQGGREILKSHGFNLSSVCGIFQMLDILRKSKTINESTYKETYYFFEQNKA